VTGGSTRFRQAPDALSRSVGGDVIVAPLGRDDFELLSGTASAVWSLLTTTRTVPDLVDVLAEAYRGSRESITADVRGLIAELRSRGLVDEITDT
jgi:hypothetical protein